MKNINQSGIGISFNFSLYLIFNDKEFININKIDIKTDNTIRKGNVAKFIFKLNNKIEVNVVTGNLFRKKVRKSKLYKNNDYYENDMIYHKLYFNKKIIYTNKVTPISSLLNNFELAIKNKDFSTSLELIEASVKQLNF